MSGFDKSKLQGLQSFKKQIQGVRGIAGDLNEFFAREDERINECLRPFVDKLTALSKDYEMEKAALEKDMMLVLESSKSAVVGEIVEQRASARHYSSMVSDFFEKTTSMLRDGLQARRDAERAFTEKMMDCTRSEYEQIVAAMRSEDRKKSHFERVENHQKLESCRIAVRIDLAARLLQQRAQLDRQKKEEMAKKDAEMQAVAADAAEQVARAKDMIAEARAVQENSRVELKVVSERARKEIEALENEILAQHSKARGLQERITALEEECKRLMDEADNAEQDKRLFEEEMNDNMEELKDKVARREAAFDAKQAAMEERMREIQGELTQRGKELTNLRRERDMLQRGKDEYTSKTLALTRKHEEEAGRLTRALDDLSSEAEGLRASTSEAQARLEEAMGEMEQLKASYAQEAAESEEKWKQIKADLEVGHRKTLREKALLRSNLGVWLHDEVSLRRKQPVDMAFDGSDGAMRESYAFFKGVEQHDLRALHKICLDKIAGAYMKSPDRMLVSRMDTFQNLGNDFEGGGEFRKEMEPPVSTEASFAGSSRRPSVESVNAHGSDAHTLASGRQPSVDSLGLPHGMPHGIVSPEASLQLSGSGAPAAQSGLGAPVQQVAQQVVVQQVVQGGYSKEEMERRCDLAVTAIKKQYEDKIEVLTTEWRAKAVGLAQRLERTERELNYPRADDLAKMQELERQVHTLMLALEGATGGAVRPPSRGREPPLFPDATRSRSGSAGSGSTTRTGPGGAGSRPGTGGRAALPLRGR